MMVHKHEGQLLGLSDHYYCLLVVVISQSCSIYLHVHIHLSCSSSFFFRTVDFLVIKSICKHAHKFQSKCYKPIITSLHPGSKTHIISGLAAGCEDYWPWGKRKRTWLQLLWVAALLTPSECFGCVEKARAFRVMQWRSDYETAVWCSFTAHGVTETPGNLTAEGEVAMCCAFFLSFLYCPHLPLSLCFYKNKMLLLWQHVWDGMLSRLF